MKVPSLSSSSIRFISLKRRAIHTSLNMSQPIYESTSAAKLSIAIVGAGIGGLSAAIALARDGHHVTVYESTPELSEV